MNRVSLKVLDEPAATAADRSPLERDLPNILANYCSDLIDWACEQGLTKDEALQVMRDFADRGRVSDIRNSPVPAQARAAH